METLYRKVQSSERNPTIEGIYGTSRGLLTFSKTFGWVTFQNYTTAKPDYWLEEITTPTKIEKLQADKAELLEALEKCNNELHFYSGHTDIVKEIESLIQKHKQ